MSRWFFAEHRLKCRKCPTIQERLCKTSIEIFLNHHRFQENLSVRARVLLFLGLGTNQGLHPCSNTGLTNLIDHATRYICNVTTMEVKMQATIKKWGNSPALRISSSIMALPQLTVNQAVNVNVVKGKIIIEPIAPKNTCLEDLLAGITTDNIHREESFGRPVGKEIL